MMHNRVGRLTLLVCGSGLVCASVAHARRYTPSRYTPKLRLAKSYRKNWRASTWARRCRSQFFHPAPSATEVNDLVTEAATRFEIDPQLVCAIIKVESAYNTNAVSRVGARGLMQLMPATARRFGVKSAFNPKQNIAGGTAYLKQLLHLFSGNIPLAVAAYNAGEHAVQREGGIPPYPETIDYVKKVSNRYTLGVVSTVHPIPVAG